MSERREKHSARTTSMSIATAVAVALADLAQGQVLPTAGGVVPVAAVPCTIVNLRDKQADALPLLAAACGKTAIVVGEAKTYTVVWSAMLSSLLVVRQRPFRTDVSAVVLGSGGSVRVEELMPAIERALMKAGRVRAPQLAVDAGEFATTGALTVTPVPSPALKIGKTPPTTTALSIDVASAWRQAEMPAVTISSTAASTITPATTK